MIAALPMYDPPVLRAANDRLWGLVRDGLRARGIAAPEGLTREGPDLWQIWQAPDLVLAQTCGFPFRARLHGRVTLVGTPDYGVAGCGPGEYRSVIVARQARHARRGLAARDGAVLAYNDAMSQSGWAAPVAMAATLGVTLVAGPCTGAHHASVIAVATGAADLAAIDAVTWRILTATEPAAAALSVVDLTPPTPGLPLIAAPGTDAGATFAAVAAAIAALSPEDRARLGLRGIVRIPAAAYLAVPDPAPPDRTGGPR